MPEDNLSPKSETTAHFQLGQTIREIRQQEDIGLTEFARRTNLQCLTCHTLKNGVKAPGDDVINDIARNLGFSAGLLMLHKSLMQLEQATHAVIDADNEYSIQRLPEKDKVVAAGLAQKVFDLVRVNTDYAKDKDETSAAKLEGISKLLQKGRPLEELDLGESALFYLKRSGIKTIEQLTDKLEEELESFYGIGGPRSYEIQYALDESGIRLRRPGDPGSLSRLNQLVNNKPKLTNDTTKLLVQLFAKETNKVSKGDEKSDLSMPDRAIIDESIARLSPRERQVLSLRFGLNGSPKLTLKSIGESQNVTVEMIRQIENRALNKLWRDQNFRIVVNNFR